MAHAKLARPCVSGLSPSGVYFTSRSLHSSYTENCAAVMMHAREAVGIEPRGVAHQ